MSVPASDALAQLRILMIRKRAEHLRRDAVELAHEYGKLARRSRLDTDVVGPDVAAVVGAWHDVVAASHDA